ncbi:hypothetical protein O8C86_03540 [Aliarcobacter butzleri]|uniref:hypothetical protein n=1 Tax=Aliarcobacter butzleri TaxID=28197 RepID=UPI00263D0AB0|nr:hypothetical protein [Aliarcobacter butzleri]MDN5060912.1 hypothetical protein [Aliarcobacter butzleri]
MENFIGQLVNKHAHVKITEDKELLKKLKESNQNYFNTVYDFESVDYHSVRADYKLDSDKYFHIDYSDSDEEIQKSLLEYFKMFDSTGEISKLDKKDLGKLELLIYGKKVNNKYKLNFQTITKRNFITSKILIGFKLNSLEIKEQKNELEFKDSIDVIIDEESQKIYFKNFSDLKKIDNVFIELYKEATIEEVHKFIEDVNEFKEFNIESSKLKLLSTNLKKLKYAHENGMVKEVLSKKTKVNKYIRKYKEQLELKKIDGIFQIKENKDMTSFLKVIYESLYEGEITGKKLESNSSQEIKI